MDLAARIRERTGGRLGVEIARLSLECRIFDLTLIQSPIGHLPWWPLDQIMDDVIEHTGN